MAMKVRPFPYSPHDYDEVLSRWKTLAREAGLQFGRLVAVSGRSVWMLSNPGLDANDARSPFYLSAGVHGDECAPVWALLEWAEDHVATLLEQPCIVFPCLNPAGFIANTRNDGRGRDLNRSFQDSGIPLIAAWQQAIAGKRFSRCLSLHEDFDARGIYLYELCDTPGLGEKLIRCAEEIIPRDPNGEIDGREFNNAVARHERNGLEELARQELEGYPEAIYLFLKHSPVSITFETPSEMDLSFRIEAHKRAIAGFVRER